MKLRDRHLYRGRIDGLLGPRTKLALEKWQRQAGLPATGKLDRQTLASLSGGMTSGQGSSMPSGKSSTTPSGKAPGAPSGQGSAPRPGY